MKLRTIAYGLLLSFSCGCAATPPPTVIVKHDLAPPPKPVVPPDPYAALPPDIAAAIKRGDTTIVFRHGITLIYPYSPDRKYVVNCQPNMATSILLRDDEDTDENDTVLGDSNRWSFTIGLHSILLKPTGTNKAITIPGPQPQTRPPDPDMNSNLQIVTSKRRYELILRIRRPFTDTISWYYTHDVQQEAAERERVLKALAQENPR
jgi:Conjugal transfer protein